MGKIIFLCICMVYLLGAVVMSLEINRLRIERDHYKAFHDEYIQILNTIGEDNKTQIGMFAPVPERKPV